MDEQTVSMGDGDDYPPEDSEDTWHVHDDKTWQWGVNCEVCHTPKLPKGYDGPYFNIRHLQTQNVLSVTTAEMEKDIIGDLDPEKVQRAR